MVLHKSTCSIDLSWLWIHTGIYSEQAPQWTNRTQDFLFQFPSESEMSAAFESSSLLEDELLLSARRSFLRWRFASKSARFRCSCASVSGALWRKYITFRSRMCCCACCRFVSVVSSFRAAGRERRGLRLLLWDLGKKAKCLQKAEVQSPWTRNTGTGICLVNIMFSALLYMVTGYRFLGGALSLYMVLCTCSAQLDPPLLK